MSGTSAMEAIGTPLTVAVTPGRSSAEPDTTVTSPDRRALHTPGADVTWVRPSGPQDHTCVSRVVGGPHQDAGPGPGGYSRHDLQPHRVVVGAQQPRRAVGRIDLQDAHGPLVAGLHDDQRAPVVPVRGDQVGELATVPRDGGPAAVQLEQHQRDVRVRGSGGRVGHLVRLDRRVRGVGDVPALDGRLVHPGGQQGLPVRGPPVAPHPPHLLGRDELGQAIGDLIGLRLHEGRVLAARQLMHPQRPANAASFTSRSVA